MALSCFIISLLCGAATAFVIYLIIHACLCCLGYTHDGVRSGSLAACCMSSGHGHTPACVACGQYLGANGLPCIVVTCIFLTMTVVVLFMCPTITGFYCERIAFTNSLCYNSTGTSCFTFFGSEYCDSNEE